MTLTNLVLTVGECSTCADLARLLGQAQMTCSQLVWEP